jgi:serine-type D-Ala-D-Ala carboxypeptidase (penicillin-binding protein 5/6)
MAAVAVVAAAAFALAVAAPGLAGPPRVEARAWIVANATTGEVLGSYHARRRLPIASLTKLMTVRLALERLRPADVVTVGTAAAAVGESSIDLRPGERLSVRDLLKGALIQSANDAADALAAAAARGDTARFVRLMNAEARRLGLRDTHYVRPDGLDAPGHVSSARDVLELAQLVMHERVVRTIVRERTDTIAGGRVLHTWNDLLGRVRGVIGVKTGHTGAAGWCQVAAIRRPGTTVYAVLLGSPSRARRNADLARLLLWGASQYRVASVLPAGRSLARVRLGYGRAPLDLVPARPLRAVVRVRRPLVERVVAPTATALPVARGQRLGTIEVWAGRRLVGRRPLVAARTVSRPGVAGRVGWYAGRTAHHVWSWLT